MTQKKKTGRYAAAALTTGFVLVACATSASSEDALADYEFTGESRNCLAPRDITSLTALDEETILFRAKVNRLFINRVGPGCNGADNPFRRLQYDVNAGSLCKNETLKVVDNGDNLTAGFCRLNVFEEVVEASAD